MATEFFKLPTVNNNKDAICFIDAVNGLANSTDAVTEEIVEGFRQGRYELPISTKQQLGGVRIGEGWDFYSDGEITPSSSDYVLPVATDKNLGGIIAGENIAVDESGKIRLGEKAYQYEDFVTNQFAEKAVTTEKFPDNAINKDKVSNIITSNLNVANNAFKNPQVHTFYVDTYLSGYSSFVLKIVDIGGIRIAIASIDRKSSGLRIESGQSYDILTEDSVQLSTLIKSSLEMSFLVRKSDLPEITENGDLGIFDYILKLIFEPSENKMKVETVASIDGQVPSDIFTIDNENDNVAKLAVIKLIEK